MISLDLETTGLDPERHEAWEVGLVDLDSNDEYLFEFPVQNLRSAEAGALSINGYYARCAIPYGSDIAHIERNGEPTMVSKTWTSAEHGAFSMPGADPRDAAFLIAKLTAGRTLMGCAVHFDTTFLGSLLRYYDTVPCWHHRHLDLGSWAAGILGRDKPLASAVLAREVKPNDQPHTALGDARWNVTVYRNLIATQTERQERLGAAKLAAREFPAARELPV